MDKIDYAEIIARGGKECDLCHQRMLIADGCTCSHITCGGKTYERIRYGKAEDDEYLWAAEEGDRCHDCGALYGHYHHSGCDVERCPVCGEQFIGCDCDLEFIVI